MQTDFTFIGRKRELTLLKELIDSPSPSIGIVYGRRRIGKTELIKKAFTNKRVLIFEGLENKSKREQIENFIFQLYYQTKTNRIIPKPATWKDAFIQLYEIIKNNNHHLIFDEFQWMANYRSEIVSDLKFVWDQYFTKNKGITLILCGSIASFMISKIIKSNALYGRTDLQIHLKAFKIDETKKMMPEKGLYELMEAQMYTGGVPKYLNLLLTKSSVRRGMDELAFEESGYFFSEYERIFTSHFGRNPNYEKIIKILAQHQYGLYRKEVAKKSNITQGGLLSTLLFNLESAGFISSKTPLNKHENSRLIRYYLTDAYLRFYFNFIAKNRNKIKSGVQKDIFQKITQKGEFYNWIGRSFEYFCIDHAEKIVDLLGFSGIEFSFGPYFRSAAKSKNGVQIDLLFNRADNIITLCEMKYSLNPVGKEVITQVEKKVNILQNNFANKTIQKVLITLNGASKDVSDMNYFYRIINVKEFL